MQIKHSRGRTSSQPAHPLLAPGGRTGGSAGQTCGGRGWGGISETEAEARWAPAGQEAGLTGGRGPPPACHQSQNSPSPAPSREPHGSKQPLETRLSGIRGDTRPHSHPPTPLACVQALYTHTYAHSSHTLTCIYARFTPPPHLLTCVHTCFTHTHPRVHACFTRPHICMCALAHTCVQFIHSPTHTLVHTCVHSLSLHVPTSTLSPNQGFSLYCGRIRKPAPAHRASFGCREGLPRPKPAA